MITRAAISAILSWLIISFFPVPEVYLVWMTRIGALVLLIGLGIELVYRRALRAPDSAKENQDLGQRLDSDDDLNEKLGDVVVTTAFLSLSFLLGIDLGIKLFFLIGGVWASVRYLSHSLKYVGSDSDSDGGMGGYA